MYFEKYWIAEIVKLKTAVCIYFNLSSKGAS